MDNLGQDAVLEVAALVEDLAAAHRLVAEQTLAPEGVGAAAAGLMWIVSRAEPALSMREIAAMLTCDPSYVTVLSLQLEKAGLLERRPDSADRRRRTLHLTPAGRAASGRVRDAILAATGLSALSAGALDGLRATLQEALSASSPHDPR
jgi:MarR family transcriptional regulator for hemolysin